MGRPPGSGSKYTLALADEIVTRLSAGETLRAICRDVHMPSWRAIYDWLEAHPDFAARIAIARDLGYDAIAEEALHIADTPVEGQTIREDKDGKTITREDMLGHRKLRVWTRLQLLAKWNPKKYGNRQQIEHSGAVTLESLVADSGLRDGDE